MDLVMKKAIKCMNMTSFLITISLHTYLMCLGISIYFVTTVTVFSCVLPLYACDLAAENSRSDSYLINSYGIVHDDISVYYRILISV